MFLEEKICHQMKILFVNGIPKKERIEESLFQGLADLNFILQKTTVKIEKDIA